MKRNIIIYFLVTSIIAPCISVSAASVDNIEVDINNNQISVEGNARQSPNGENITFFVRDTANPGSFEYINIISTDENGDYTHTFSLGDRTANYTFGTVDNQGNQNETSVSLYDQNTLDTFAQNVANGSLSDIAIISGLEEYSVSLNYNTTLFSDSRNKNLILTEISQNRAVIAQGKAVALSTVIQNAEEKCNLLDSIQNAASWYEVDSIICANSSNLGISLTKYERVSDKSKVCSPFIGTRVQSIAEFAQKFNEAVNKYVGSTGGTPSGSGGGGGSSMGTSSIKIPDIKPAQNSGNGVFYDVSSSHWANEAILALNEKGIVSGMGDGTFSPDSNVTRGQAARIISSAFDITLESNNCNFADVPNDLWARKYVSALYEAGIINGISETEFGINNELTRQDLAVILYRALVRAGYEFNEQKTDFTDFDIISEYAREAVAYMAGSGIINGMGDNRFAPFEKATRAQMCKLVYESLKLIK